MEMDKNNSSCSSFVDDLMTPGGENLKNNSIICDEMQLIQNDNRNITTEKKGENNSIIDHIPLMECNSNFDDSLNKSTIIFKSKDNQMTINMFIVLDACPAIQRSIKEITRKDVIISLPDWITPKNVSEFFIYYNDENYSDFSISVRKLLLICDYFDNQVLVSKVINSEIIPYLNMENSLLFLEDSFLKLNSNAENRAWFDLFYTALSSVSKYLIFYLENSYEKLKNVNKKILEEII